MRFVRMILAIAVAPAVMAAEPQPQLKLLGTLEEARPGVYATIAFSPDSKLLAASDDNSEENVGVVKLWDVDKRKVVATFRGQTARVSSLAFSPDGKTLAVGGDDQGGDRTVRLWDVPTRKEKASLKGPIGFLAFSPDGKTLATTSARDRTVTLWDLATLQEKASFKGDRGNAYSIAFSPDGQLIALGWGQSASNGQASDGGVTLWDVATGKEKASLKGMVWVWSVAFSPDSKTLASADVYGNVLLWDVQSGKRSATLQAFNPRAREKDINGSYSVAFSPDGNTLVAGTIRGVLLWEVKSGKKVGGLNLPAGTTWSVAFSPDGKTVASAGSKRVIGPKDSIYGDETLRLWELVPAKKAEK